MDDNDSEDEEGALLEAKNSILSNIVISTRLHHDGDEGYLWDIDDQYIVSTTNIERATLFTNQRYLNEKFA